jgi:DMSO/TMAO reductase YedYZ heme-binding membrane subunit
VRFSPQARKVALTAHVTTSVGWLGAVVGVLALAIAGVSTADDQTVRSVYIAMRVTAWAVLVPLAFASLATGVLQALGTRWGLLRHYWVVTKLVITVMATAVLLLYTQTIDVAADTAVKPMWSPLDRATLRSPTVIVHSSLALVLLVVTTILAIFKPSGLTGRGRRQAAADATSD